MGIEISGLDDLNRFGVELGKIASKALPDVEAVLKKGANNIKEDLKTGVRGSHFRGLAGSITYDSMYSPGVARFEVGPDKYLRGGALGNIYYFGGSRGGGHGDLEGPLMREAPEVYNQLGKVADGWANRL